ncbi:MAG: DUF817 domain-containing protein [Deltaproteobacteria bacterium]|nr:DUF817 domain-containing protein [Deltaproteobacteria bacterium]
MLKELVLSAHRRILRDLQRRPSESGIAAFVREFLAFGYKEAISCIFPVFIFGMLAITRFVSVPGIPRYDVLLIACLLMQWFMYSSKMESRNELYVICIFHFMGIAMEIYKVHHGSWAYPEPGYSKVFGVPLYSGFMYASVASYLCQAWRNFELKFEHWPSIPVNAGYTVAIYGNFYSNVYLLDLRLLIIPLLLLGFRRTVVYFNTNGNIRHMPMSLSFLLIAFFIWLAENFGTALGAWRYPHQHAGWSAVKLQIMSSWFLLVIVSILIIAMLKQAKLEMEMHRPDR